MMPEQQKLRVMQLCQSLLTGGLEQMVLSLAMNLPSEQYERSICCLDRAGDLAEQARRGGVTVFEIAKGGGVKPATILALARLLRKEKIDVLHSHNAGCLIYGAPAAKLARIPVMVHTEHGRMLDEFDKKWLNRAEKFCSRWVKELVAVSEPTRDAYIKMTGIARNRVRIIGNGVDIARFQVPAKATLREELGIKTGDIVVGIIARLSEEKDHPTLIRAFRRVVDTAPNYRLLIVGDGPQRSELESLIQQLGLQHKIILTGSREDVPDILALLDIFVLCSRTEGMPLTLLEAMAAGKTILCTPVGGIPNIIQDGRNGLLFPPGNADKLADLLLKVIRDRTLSTQLRTTTRQDAERKYGIARMVQAYESLYRQNSTE